MSFFANLPVRPQMTHDDLLRWGTRIFDDQSRAIIGPPDGWVGGRVAWNLTLIEEEAGSIILREFSVYPSGITFRADMRFREGLLNLKAEYGEPPHLMYSGDDPASPSIGVCFSDGRKTRMGPGVFVWDFPDEPLLMGSGGGIGGPNWQESGMWLYPLPPPGCLDFVAAWDALGIPEKVITVDANELIEASRSAHPGE